MKIQLLLLAFLFSHVSAANTKQYTSLLTALETNAVQVVAMSKGGLDENNLHISIRNLKADTSYITIPPGLHFKSVDARKQDLLTISEVLLAIGPGERNMVQLKGFCMQATKGIPSRSGSYKLAGYAETALVGLADRLYLHERLTAHYGQMFVWAITDNRKMRDIAIDSSLVEVTRSVVKYVADITKQSLVKVEARASDVSSPALELFTKTAVLAFHNPVDQTGSLHLYDASGNVVYTLFTNRKIERGLKVYEVATNDLIPVGSDPNYYLKVTNTTGKVLAQMKIDKNTVERDVKPEVINFKFEYQLQQPVKEARIKVYLQDGTLVEEFKRYTNLAPGHYVVNMRFMHLHAPETNFIAKLVAPDGKVYKEMVVKKED